MLALHRSVTAILIGAAFAGVLVGIGSAALPPSVVGSVSTFAREAAVATGIVRRRPPQPGDHWRGCHDAREAGTAPIYRDEPGYSVWMDGDNDGVACEAWR